MLFQLDIPLAATVGDEWCCWSQKASNTALFQQPARVKLFMNFIISTQTEQALLIYFSFPVYFAKRLMFFIQYDWK